MTPASPRGGGQHGRVPGLRSRGRDDRHGRQPTCGAIVDYAPFDFGLPAGEADEYVIAAGAFSGQRGFFTRDDSGAVVGVDLAGELFSRSA
jgi:hypothetical protein